MLMGLGAGAIVAGLGHMALKKQSQSNSNSISISIIDGSVHHLESLCSHWTQRSHALQRAAPVM